MIALPILLVAPLQQVPPAAESFRPSFKFLQQAEDWSRFRSVEGDEDPFDPLKHVDLSSDGSIWASFGGRLETRLESWRNFNFGASGPSSSFDDEFLLSRAILHADLHVGESFRLYVEGKSAQSTDRDLPGGRRPLDLDTLELQQAFIEIEVANADASLCIRPGRQSLLFGAQRLISPLPWGNTLRAWDGVTADWRTSGWNITGMATAFVPVDKTSPNEVDRDTTLFGLYATRAPVKGGRGLDLYAIGNQRPNVTVNGTTGDERRNTFGFRTWGPVVGSFDLEVEAAFQEGHVGPGDVSAWFIAIEAGWRSKTLAGTPRFWLGFDAASGDDGAGGDVGTFHQLFPLGHAYLGYADIVGRQNSLDLSAGATWQIAPRTSLSIDLHHFQLMETEDALYDAGGRAFRSGFDSRQIGNEIDVLVQSEVGRHVNLYGGYSHVFAGDAIEETGSSEDIDFVYFGAGYTF